MGKEENWTIVINPCGTRQKIYHHVYCTEEELEIVARALYNKYDCCACVAKRGGYASLNDFDICFCDCM